MTNSDCETASVGLCGVWETHGSASERGGLGGVWSRILISSLDIIDSGLKKKQTKSLKPFLNIPLGYGNNVGNLKGNKKFDLGNMVNI